MKKIVKVVLGLGHPQPLSSPLGNLSRGRAGHPSVLRYISMSISPVIDTVSSPKMQNGRTKGPDGCL